MYKGVIFDLDGTLLDTVEDLAAATNEILIKHGMAAQPIANYNYYLGGGVYNLLRRALKDQPEGLRLSDEAIESTLHDLVIEQKKIYAEIWMNTTRPYDGIPELLNALKAERAFLGVVSNKPHHFTVEMVQHYFGSNVFDIVVGQKEGIPVKPHPSMLVNAAHEMQISLKDVLYIGDTDTDMQTAVNAGADSVGVSWGFRTTQELLEHQAKFIATNPSDIYDIFKNSK